MRGPRFDVAAAAGLFALWMLVTYLLEGRADTFRRADQVSRFVYTVLANVCIGTIGAAMMIRALAARGTVARTASHGIARPRRIALLVSAAAVASGAFLMTQQLPTSNPVVLTNAFAQVLVVSIAEVIVCWALFGTVVRHALGKGLLPATLAIVLAALAFGAYHFAHSPPFNSVRMVLLLSGVGLATGTWFFASGDLYSTIVLHNAFALRGVLQAMSDAGTLDRYATLQYPLLTTAVGAIAVLVVSDAALIRPRVATPYD